MRIKILFILFLLVFLSACGKDSRRAEEVLVGRDCGMDKLKCCDEDPPCSYGQKCCPDLNNSGQNYCSNECTYGGEEEFCFLGGGCNNGLECLYGICYTCGKEDSACCEEGSFCEDGLACLDGKCVKCGEVGNPCCDNSGCAQKEGKRVQCSNDICSFCGFDDNLACVQGEKCARGNIYNNGDCLRCGNYNNPCCDFEAGLGYMCDIEKNLICKNGFCAKNK